MLDIDYRKVRQFRRFALRTLPKVAAVYPDAQVRRELDEGGRPVGLRLEPSPPHARQRPRRLT
jgi:hypothetical protein